MPRTARAALRSRRRFVRYAPAGRGASRDLPSGGRRCLPTCPYGLLFGSLFEQASRRRSGSDRRRGPATRGDSTKRRPRFARPPLLARPEGFEPPAPKFVVWCSIQLSYGRVGGRHIGRLPELGNRLAGSTLRAGAVHRCERRARRFARGEPAERCPSSLVAAAPQRGNRKESGQSPRRPASPARRRTRAGAWPPDRAPTAELLGDLAGQRNSRIFRRVPPCRREFPQPRMMLARRPLLHQHAALRVADRAPRRPAALSEYFSHRRPSATISLMPDLSCRDAGTIDRGIKSHDDSSSSCGRLLATSGERPRSNMA